LPQNAGRDSRDPSEGGAMKSRETTRPERPGTGADNVDTDIFDTDVFDTGVFDASVSTVTASNLSLHDLFAQQARYMLERADIDEEQKQAILVAMSCPCCGGGGMSFSVKLKD
jgi:hypothetical protein